MERWLHDGCRCTDPTCAPGTCPCGGAGARRYVARLGESRGWSCLRCGRPELAGRLCGDCAAIVATERATLPARPSYPCAFCRARRGAGLDLGGVFLCDVCSSWDLWNTPPRSADDVLPPCSFCGEVPHRVGIVAGPTIYLCSRCVARAHALRRADHRDPPRNAPRACSFDGKSFRELGELFVVGELAFCDECVGLFDELHPVLDMKARLGISSGAEADRCIACGGGEHLLRPEHGPSLCKACVDAGKRVGPWCLVCNHAIDAAERAAEVESGFLCEHCTVRELHLARLTAFVEQG